MSFRKFKSHFDFLINFFFFYLQKYYFLFTFTLTTKITGFENKKHFGSSYLLFIIISSRNLAQKYIQANAAIFV